MKLNDTHILTDASSGWPSTASLPYLGQQPALEADGGH
jgi:hypothetical protein